MVSIHLTDQNEDNYRDYTTQQAGGALYAFSLKLFASFGEPPALEGYGENGESVEQTLDLIKYYCSAKIITFTGGNLTFPSLIENIAEDPGFSTSINSIFRNMINEAKSNGTLGGVRGLTSSIYYALQYPFAQSNLVDHKGLVINPDGSCKIHFPEVPKFNTPCTILIEPIKSDSDDTQYLVRFTELLGHEIHYSSLEEN